jgi:hypothetical protein
LTRVSTSIGLYAACGAIMLAEVIALGRGSSRVLHRIVLPSLILVSFAGICGYINQARWGSPFTFQDYKYYNSLGVNAAVYDVLMNYDYFDIGRIPFGLSYFFFPVWAIIGPDGHFLFRALRDRLYYTVELPPTTFFASDLMLCFLSALGRAWLWRGGSIGFDRWTARLIALCFLIPGLLMLMAIALTFRYAVSVIGAHVFLLAYKMAPWNDAAVVENIGWDAALHKYFRLTYPGLDRALGHWY